ncbi:BTAD domain-containing putative transcriptional regulator [Streptomyces sp. NPDC051771]|uniref:AfsR/SARP family transcriptional regulator n=1 Tax=Streptomyces sp. NPDC051771 TaxID=3154847 RepID=UPI0034203AA2
MNVTPSAQLRLLGRFRLECGRQSIELCRNGQRLLAFLSLRESVPRTVLAGTLWPEVTEEHARGSLRTTLWKLPRDELPLVHCCGDVLMVAPALRVDVHVLTRTALGLVAGGAPPSYRRPPLGLLTGEDLLPGWDEDWVLLERERLRQLRLYALDSLAHTLIEQGRTALAMEAAWAGIRAEPLRESAHRVVVSVHLAEGNVGEALGHYAMFRTLLNEELGIEPSLRFTRLLAERLPYPQDHQRARSTSGGEHALAWLTPARTTPRDHSTTAPQHHDRRSTMAATAQNLSLRDHDEHRVD